MLYWPKLYWKQFLNFNKIVIIPDKKALLQQPKYLYFFIFIINVTKLNSFISIKHEKKKKRRYIYHCLEKNHHIISARTIFCTFCNILLLKLKYSMLSPKRFLEFNNVYLSLQRKVNVTFLMQIALLLFCNLFYLTNLSISLLKKSLFFC